MKNKKDINKQKGKYKILFLIILFLIALDTIVLGKYIVALQEDKNNQKAFDIEIIPTEINLMSGNEINKKITGNSIKNVVFGNKSTYLNEINGYDGEVISVAESAGTAKIYIVENETAYILAENDGKMYANSDCSKMFLNNSDIKQIKFENFNTEKTVNMESMFEGCNSLENLDFSNFKTSAVTNMQWMFSNCFKLNNIDLSGFNTSKVTNMQGMFWNCFTMTSLDISNFNTSQVVSTKQMFGRELDKGFITSNLKSINLGQINTSKVTDMAQMFSGCSGLSSIDVSKFDTNNVLDMQEMFANCENISNLDISNFDTSNVKTMEKMFLGCKSLETLNVSNFNTENVTNMKYMFSNIEKVKNLDLSNFNTSNVTEFAGMFLNNPELTTIYSSENFIINSSANYSDVNLQSETIYMFNGCDKLVGRNGTALINIKNSGASNEEIYGKKYAWMDGVNYIPGYFTSKYNETLTINTQNAEVEAGQTLQLTATSSKADSVITWESCDTSLATIDTNGLITGKAIGTVTITAYGSYNEKTSIEINVTPEKYNKTILAQPSGSTIKVTANNVEIANGIDSVTVRVLPETTISYEITKKYYQAQSGELEVTENNTTTSVTLSENPTNVITIVPSSVEGTDGIVDMDRACRKAEVDKGTNQYANCDDSGEFTFTWVFAPSTSLNSEAKITAVTTYANMCYNSVLYTDKTGVYITVTDNSGDTSFSYTTEQERIDEERIKVGNTQKIITCNLSTLPTATQINEGIKYHAKRGTTNNKNLNWYGAHIEVSYIDP